MKYNGNKDEDEKNKLALFFKKYWGVTICGKRLLMPYNWWHNLNVLIFKTPKHLCFPLLTKIWARCYFLNTFCTLVVLQKTPRLLCPKMEGREGRVSQVPNFAKYVLRVTWLCLGVTEGCLLSVWLPLLSNSFPSVFRCFPFVFRLSSACFLRVFCCSLRGFFLFSASSWCCPLLSVFLLLLSICFPCVFRCFPFVFRCFPSVVCCPPVFSALWWWTHPVMWHLWFVQFVRTHLEKILMLISFLGKHIWYLSIGMTWGQ